MISDGPVEFYKIDMNVLGLHNTMTGLLKFMNELRANAILL